MPSLRRRFPVPAALVAALLLAPAAADAGVRAHESSASVDGVRTFRLAPGTTHLAVHWRGARAARVRIRLSRDGVHFGPARRVALDEIGAERRGRETYGAVMRARGMRAVRVSADRRLPRLSVLAMDARRARAVRPSATAASVSQPAITLRAGWGADESLRYDASGNEIWPPAFYPVQKLIVHHTATQNGDPDPRATIRSIYYYHTVTQGWGDIGYNFLIDEAGTIYEGRHTFDPPSASPPGEDSRGDGVTAAHATGYNSGTVGIALLGTLTNQDATPAARAALEQLLAWEADRHGIDPQGSSLYTNPVNGTQATFPNIAGHRDVAATECPGGAFYATLPTIRTDVATMLGGGTTTTAPTATTGTATGVTRSGATLNGTVDPNGQATTVRFDYGRTTAYGAATATTSAGSGTTAVPVAATVGGLKRGTVYHFRVVAIDAGGVAHPGADATFRTAR